MPTFVGILTSISMINITSERLKARNFFICLYFSFNEQFVLSRVEHEKSFITSVPACQAEHNIGSDLGPICLIPETIFQKNCEKKLHKIFPKAKELTTCKVLNAHS